MSRALWEGRGRNRLRAQRELALNHSTGPCLCDPGQVTPTFLGLRFLTERWGYKDTLFRLVLRVGQHTKCLTWPGTSAFSKWKLLPESIKICPWHPCGPRTPESRLRPLGGSSSPSLPFRAAVSLVTCDLKGFRNGPSIPRYVISPALPVILDQD